jgi:hypothetical protein
MQGEYNFDGKKIKNKKKTRSSDFFYSRLTFVTLVTEDFYWILLDLDWSTGKNIFE